jgi:hypothetical protein
MVLHLFLLDLYTQENFHHSKAESIVVSKFLYIHLQGDKVHWLSVLLLDTTGKFFNPNV